DSEMSAPSHIVVAADTSLAAARIEALLRKDPHADVVISAAGELAALATERAASVVILAMSAPSVERALERLAGAPRMRRVIVLTPSPHAAWTIRARRRGVRAVLHRDAGAEELAAAIAATRAGLLALHPDAVLGASTPVSTPSTDAPVSLTTRETE